MIRNGFLLRGIACEFELQTHRDNDKIKPPVSAVLLRLFSLKIF